MWLLYCQSQDHTCIDPNSAKAFFEFRALLQAFIKAPNVKTLGLSFLSFTPASKISRAVSSFVGRALEQASIALFINRIDGFSTPLYSASASLVLPDLPRPIMFFSKSRKFILDCSIERETICADIRGSSNVRNFIDRKSFIRFSDFDWKQSDFITKREMNRNWCCLLRRIILGVSKKIVCTVLSQQRNEFIRC